MKRKARMTALLASKAAAQPVPGWTFDPDRMIRIPDCHSIIEVLRHIKHGGPEWAHRNVAMCFPGPSNAWALVYSLQNDSAPYFDFMYTHKEPPQEALSALLAKYPQCTVIDWSLGRLACIRAQGVNVETLAEIIRDVAEAAWDERVTVIDASYEKMGRA
ncbi:hypothetical protein KJF94_14855 [Pseudomonas hormoni]|uniref:Uncharacterized protein n=1 Tax=Pseudomonas hormoni TaxID=3093767 RepID=A0ABX8F5C3_9PSED|nr:hypothetical protein [Pseudomonas hormoni]QVW26730.1 hypothetical protein KJF94_14855 [Pseudomonas hormoni]